MSAQAAVVGVYFWIEQSREARANGSFGVEVLSGWAARDLVLETPQGQRRTLQRTRGKTVVLHFWATWCAPCRTELPQLLELGRELERERGGIEIVAVAVNDDWKAIRDFFGGRVPPAIHLDASGDAAEAFEVSALPDTYVLDASGMPRARMAGTRNWRTAHAAETLRRLSASWER
jgi:thiol-disulfide isomerase/thioredoxin